MEAYRLLAAVAVAAFSLSTIGVRGQGLPTCLKVDACSCRLSSTNEVISLQGLNGNKKLMDGIVGHDGYRYHFNPCQATLDLSTTCNPSLDSAVCQEAGADDFYSLGRTSHVEFKVVSDSPLEVTFTYDGGTADGDNIRQLELTVMCDLSQTDDLVYVKEYLDWGTQRIIYYMTLNSKYGCPGYSPPATLEISASISPGSIMTIIFFVLLIAYVAAFVAFGFAQQRRGRDLIPNYKFWSVLPGYIKDGAVFVFTLDGRLGGGGMRGSGKEDYEQL